MSVPDALAELASDLRALKPRERREVLGALSSFERTKIDLLLRQQRPKPSRKPPPEDFSLFSPWLAKRLALVAREPAADTSVTAATRRLLLQHAREVIAERPQSTALVLVPSRKTPFAFLTRWLLPNRGRR